MEPFLPGPLDKSGLHVRTVYQRGLGAGPSSESPHGSHGRLAGHVSQGSGRETFKSSGSHSRVRTGMSPDERPLCP